ncbi:Gfo/Idh/MocA family oxidoreductase [Amaricoccus sp.]|uniref:Gfo/Idh/MocA family protein n=1 Tax=Amaricoccus sp. TaxID=1872485 RepID=UPI001B56F68A|nr:Gfo/Idh/MocA family oxidoreductase [Amaricoccus sp.]MBP7001612.1 Gfo/Idh/MocA family oxidoreductase [Amaricoccus sp.]
MLRGGMIGCGFFAANHLNAWAGIAGAEIVALCDRDPARLAAAAERFGVARTYADAAEMLAAERLDFVDIATTVPTHRPLVELAAGAGVHMICQKPFAATMEDARAMVAAAGAAGRTLMVHENFRWQSAIRRAKAEMAAIGRPFWGRASFRSGFDVYAAQPYLATDARFIVQDLGIHILDVARFLFGDVATLAATTQRVNPRIRGEDVATMLLAHTGGVTCVVDCSYASRLPRESFPETLLEVEGTDGSLRLDAGYRLTVHAGGETRAIDAAPPLLPWAERPWHNVQESVQAIQQHFVDCLREGRAPETSGADNLRTLELVYAAYASAEDGGRTIALDGTA